MENWALPEINLQRCNRCGICVERCPTDAVEMRTVEMRTEGPFIVRPSDCTYCALCEALCPQGAITCAYEIVWEVDTAAD
ncbi:MAG: 4Fe-4S binding protein [Anaerolineae bacterium]